MFLHQLLGQQSPLPQLATTLLIIQSQKSSLNNISAIKVLLQPAIAEQNNTTYVMAQNVSSQLLTKPEMFHLFLFGRGLFKSRSVIKTFHTTLPPPEVENSCETNQKRTSVTITTFITTLEVKRQTRDFPVLWWKSALVKNSYFSTAHWPSEYSDTLWKHVRISTQSPMTSHATDNN